MSRTQPSTQKAAANSPTRRARGSAARNKAQAPATVIPQAVVLAPPPSESASVAAEADAPKGKLGIIVRLLSRPEGASLDEMSKATSWQVHSVRGAMSGALKKARGYVIDTEVGEAGRVYRIARPQVSA